MTTEQGTSALRNTVFGLLMQATTSVFTAALTVYLARALGQSGYGVFALALSIGSFALLASDAGIAFSAGRFIAERWEDRSAVASIVSATLALTLAAAFSAAALLWALSGPIASAYGRGALVWPLRGIAIAVVGQSLLLLYLRIFSAMRRVHLGVWVVLAESATETMASIALVAVGGGVTGAAFGRAVGYAIGAVTALLVARQVLGRGAFALRSRGEVAPGHILRYAGALMITNSAYTVYAAVDTLLIGAILTTGAVGLFSGPMRLVVFMGYVGESVAGAIAPRVAKAAGREPDAASWRGGLRWLVIFQTLLVAPLLVWATPIVRLLLGSQFLGSGPILRVLTLHVFLRGLSPVMSVTANYLGQGGRRLPIVLSALAVNAVIDVVLLPIVGPVGAAVGIGVAYLIYVPAHFRLCRQRIEVPLRPLARTLGRSALAAAAMALVLFAFGTERLSAPQWILGSLAGTLAFVAVLLATGEVRRTDLRRAVGFARARLSAA